LAKNKVIAASVIFASFLVAGIIRKERLLRQEASSNSRKQSRLSRQRIYFRSIPFDRPRRIPMSVQPRKVVHPDIKPENTPELASRYLDVPNMPWEATKFAGIRIKVLYSDDSGMTTALFKLDPGAVVPLHEHTALEQTYVLEGTLEDHEGVCGPGQFVWRPAGNQHEAVAPSGAVILGFFLKPNRFAHGEKFFTEDKG
jgi:quercetin dioxygenase-like cupin family protein